MADQPEVAPGDVAGGFVIDDRFRVLPGAPLADLGGYACFEAQDRRNIAGDVVALRAGASSPPRARLPAFLHVHHEALLSPLGHGAAGPGYWIITNRPPGASLASLAVPWSGNGLLTHVLRPAALALDQLMLAGLTHRAIRPDNVFLAAGAKSVVLGPCCAAPPAMHQPASFEPPYSAICPPDGRGEGSIADDVYALAVLLLALWGGRMPLAGVETREIIQLKLEFGSHAALTNGLRLQRGFDDILRAMLSDDPLARPTPAALANLDAIHPRRGGQRVAVRATRPLAIGDRMAWNRRALALICAEAPAEAMASLRHGAIEQWLRRIAEDNVIASAIEDLKREQLLLDGRNAARQSTGAGIVAGGVPGSGSSTQHDQVCLLRLIAVLDPLAPMFWRGFWFWPDGLGPLVARAVVTPPTLHPREAASMLDTLYRGAILARWRQTRPSRPEHDAPVLPARLLRRGDRDDEIAWFLRVAYLLNPFLPCGSPAFAGSSILTPVAAVAVVDRLATVGATTDRPLLDTHMLAFLDARLDDPSIDGADAAGPIEAPLRALRILSRCQALPGCGPMSRIAAALVPQLEPSFRDWPGASRKQQRLERLRAFAADGDLVAIFKLVTDTDARETDEAARQAAVREAAAIGTVLADLTDARTSHLWASRMAARDTASAIGMLCIMAVLLYEVLG